MNEQDLFLAALEIEEPAERQAHLESVCRDNAELLARVKALLASHEDGGRFLKVSLREQIAGHSAGGLEPTLTIDGRSTAEGPCDAADAMSEPAETVALDDQETSDDVGGETCEGGPLGYLAPSSRPDALGRLAHYEVLEVVGRGAFGTVLRGFDDKLRREVAIKVLARELAASEHARQRFLREARAAAAVHHENVVGVFAVEDEPIPYLVMEYVPGETLQQRLDARGPLDLIDVLRIGKQIADALAAAHAQRLVHRDIKPGNVLLDGDCVKITDFGLARAADDASISQHGQIVGTPMYMAPEQALGRPFDQRADLFSLGSVLYRMVSGQPPFRGTTTVGVLKQVAEDTPQPIREIVPEAPAWIGRLIGHLHAKDPDERYGSAQEVSDLLAGCLSDVEAGRTPTIPAPLHAAREAAEPILKAQSREAHRRPRVAALLLILLLVGLGITEATGGLSQLASVVDRLTTGAGTLVIETNRRGIDVAVGGKTVHIRDAGIEELSLRPGDYTVVGLNDGKPFQRELVTITRNERTPLRLSLESSAATAISNAATPAASKPFPWPADAPAPAIAPFDADEARQHQQAWADYLGVPVEKEVVLGQDADGKDVTLAMVLIPPGEFLMGSTEEEQTKFIRQTEDMSAKARILHEGPQHRVRITSPFWMSRHEVTLAQFRRFVEATNYQTDPEVDGKGGFGSVDGRISQLPSFVWDADLGFPRTENHPVVNVTWWDATAFCSWLSERQNSGCPFGLPTEAQWEYACRAGTTTSWHTGDSMQEVLQHDWFVKWPQAIGQFKPNSFGLYDMHGNVWEWCADWYADAYYRSSPQDDPTGAPPARYRAIRGGGSVDPIQGRSAQRNYAKADTRMYYGGFRVTAAFPEDGIRAKMPSAANAAEKSPDATPLPNSFPDAPPPAIAPFDADAAQQHQQAWAKYFGVPVEKDIVLGRDTDGKDVTLTVVLIPPGAFLMGSTGVDQAKFVQQTSDTYAIRRIPAEGPRHRVRITRPFYLGKYEVTQAQWQAVTGSKPSSFPDDPALPVQKVGWHDTETFLATLNNSPVTSELTFALPTEAQWEYACRAGTTTYWHFGDAEPDLQQYGWFAGNSGGKAHPVGQLKPNAFGLFDLHGNVWEWCADFYAPNYYRMTVLDDPQGPVSGAQFAGRGGSYNHPAGLCRSAHRAYAEIDMDHIGFRVAAAVPEDVIRAKMPSAANAAEKSPDATPLPNPFPDAPPPAIAPFDADEARQHQQAWAKYFGVPVEKDIVLGQDTDGKDVTLAMVLIPPGEFLMGSTGEEQTKVMEQTRDQYAIRRIPAEGPRHRVRITRPFYLGKYEVTQAQWQAVTGSKPSSFPDNPALPVQKVGWHDTETFLATLNNSPAASELTFALPTEAQWEYACRAGTTTYWHSGDAAPELPQYGWFAGNSGGKAHPVGQLKPNAFGLFDLHGNVWEWCADFYAPNYYRMTVLDDPPGSVSGAQFVGRGGSYNHPADFCRSAHRDYADNYLDHIGFRIAANLPEELIQAKLTASSAADSKK